MDYGLRNGLTDCRMELGIEDWALEIGMRRFAYRTFAPFVYQAFAPKGRRSVATGGAPTAVKRPVRNPWTQSHLNDSAPEGRRRLHGANKTPRSIFERAQRIAQWSTQRASPSPLRGEKGKMNRFSTGCASGRYAAEPLHPWLQPVAPPGRARVAHRGDTSGGVTSRGDTT